MHPCTVIILVVFYCQIDIPCLQRVTKRLGRKLEELCLMNCSRLAGEQILPVIQVCIILYLPREVS